ncbi:MOSC domain-containing protein [Pseudomonas sp. Marseille-QA0892]
MSAVEVRGVFIGKAERISAGLSDATGKLPVAHRVWLWSQGLGGDEQGDLRFHGGADGALHHYPAEHYEDWQRDYPHVAWAAPAFGENLSAYGLTERDVCIGDRFRWGDAVLEVSQPRSPCYRLGYRWGDMHLAQHAQDSGRCGWYYRVITPGFVGLDSSFERLSRDPARLSVARVIHNFFHCPLDRAGLHQLVVCDRLSTPWREQAARRLATGALESWAPRLLGLAPEGLRA